MLEYLSDYRTQDRMKGVHYYPSGALCWFECNQYGDPLGSVYYAKKIPDMKLLETPRRQRGLKKLKIAKEYSIKDNIAKENVDTEQWNYDKLRFK